MPFYDQKYDDEKLTFKDYLRKVILAIIVVAAAISVAYIFAGCNTPRHIAKQSAKYEKIGKEYKATHPDKVDSSTKTVYIKGKTDSVFIPLPPITMDFNVDSLELLLAKKYNTNIADCNRQVNEAFETGRKYQFDLDSKVKVPTIRIDTNKTTNTLYPTDLINTLNAKISTQNGQITELRTDKTQEHKRGNKWFYIALGLIGFGIARIFIKYRYKIAWL